MTRKEWEAHWQATRRQNIDLFAYKEQLLAIIQEIKEKDDPSPEEIVQLIRRHPYDNKHTFNKNQLVRAYRKFCADGEMPFERETLRKLQRKPIRTISGVAPVTVLTEPGPCPGECIFCPEVCGQPKSYLPDEPGAARAASLDFDPYRQTSGRIHTFESLGHNAEKVELLILGGSWSAYPDEYQEWFVRRCLDAMNESESNSLKEAQQKNETAGHRNVGLVIETRPDMITPDHVRHLRRLGVTKVQLGIQSLDDRILAMNKRGHTIATTRRAFQILRLAGFKITAHWMPNLYGATQDSDREDFSRFWKDPALRPDELKIYPTALLQNTELYKYWQNGNYAPYPENELIDLVADCKVMIPEYCRVNRVMRDIPAGNIVAGSTKSNLRQLAQNRLKEQGRQCRCIRCSEVRNQQVSMDELHLDQIHYSTDATTEHFLRYVTADQKLAGFLRLSLPNKDITPIIDELDGYAMIREIHVYGPALALDKSSKGEAQHLGLGSDLIIKAQEIAVEANFSNLAVIAAIGTRDYYRKQGFRLGELYMIKPL
ncbi:MAG: tRNA uridine(34) 5-carboxymethylaminomethyl modification radical SAM/GNAT enzyme Elp3 [Anaerolineales bacterium]|nr:tRNA uridine(34) 5-carboxymethylaminomethyl modification radical SAM/GNAT enzyme Elp3 [Anaerolineales bacterium]